MMKHNLQKFINDIREIVRKYRAEAAVALNSTIIHERWKIGILHTRVQNLTWSHFMKKGKEGEYET